MHVVLLVVALCLLEVRHWAQRHRPLQEEQQARGLAASQRSDCEIRPKRDDKTSPSRRRRARLPPSRRETLGDLSCRVVSSWKNLLATPPPERQPALAGRRRTSHATDEGGCTCVITNWAYLVHPQRAHLMVVDLIATCHRLGIVNALDTHVVLVNVVLEDARQRTVLRPSRRRAALSTPAGVSATGGADASLRPPSTARVTRDATHNQSRTARPRSLAGGLAPSLR